MPQVQSSDVSVTAHRFSATIGNSKRLTYDDVESNPQGLAKNALLHWLARWGLHPAIYARAWLQHVASYWIPTSDIEFVLSFERGLLQLNESTVQALNVSTAALVVPPSSRGFGPWWTRWLLRYVTGYETAILNEAVRAMSGRGFVRSEHSGHVYSLSYAGDVSEFSASPTLYLMLKFGTICSGVFLLFSTSTLVSFVLKVRRHS